MRIIASVLMILTLSALTIAQNMQLMPTNLRVTVLDDLGNIQEDVEVTVYANEQDYRFETNPVAGPEVTDEKGRVTFKKIPPESYYILARKGEMNNDGKGVKTSRLDEKRVNKINIVIR